MKNNNRIEIEGNYPNGYWRKFEYDSNGNQIYYEDSDGRWVKYEYDSNNKLIYYENSNGYWEKHDSNGNLIDRCYKDNFPTPNQIKQYIENGK